jgi:DNA (cytosine-5)-methyltransferase 1
MHLQCKKKDNDMKLKPYSGPYRVDPQPRLNFSGEISVDLFAGGDGASTGNEWATGKSPDIAVNHNKQAVLMHQINHPHTRHYCESVFDVNPKEVCDGRPVSHLWMSPDCTHFSKAKGSKPVSKRVRGLAWVGKRWAATVRPRIIFLENVEEFQTWGPLVRVNGDLHPCKKRAGRTFRTFIRELERLGYAVEYQTMRACDYGAPTIRKRLFLVARCDGEPIVWPEATHADPKTHEVKTGQLLPWRTAAECIDWSIPCPSIFTRKKDLAENTLRRIARGIQRYVIDAAEPFIVPITHHGQRKNHSLQDPFKTVTAAHRGELALVSPSLSTYYGAKAGNHHRGQELTEPLRTQTTENRFALQSAMLLKHYGGVVGTRLDVPAGTITTQDHHAIGAAHLVRHFGESVGSSPSEPIGTITAGGMGKTGLVAANLVRNFGTSTGADVTAPHLTITGKQKDSLTATSLVKLRGTCKHGQRADAPMPTITAGGLHVAEVRAFLTQYYGCSKEQGLTAPINTVTTKDRFGLVTVRGQLYEISDIGMRMLAPRELYRAQGFPDDYIIGYIIDDGVIVPLTITNQVRFCGNSVSPYNAAALIQANVCRAQESMAA